MTNRIEIFLKNHAALLAMLPTGLIRVSAALLAYGGAEDRMIFHSQDTDSYIGPAISLLKNGAFLAGGCPDITRTPGYPLFLIPGIVSGHIEAVAIFLQIVLCMLASYLIYKIGAIVFQSETAAMMAALLYAVEPLSVYFSMMLLTETLYSFLIILFLYFFIRFIVEDRRYLIVSSAIILSASAYVRPISVYMPYLYLCLILYLAFQCNGLTRWTEFAHGIIFIALSIALISPWQIRNYEQADYPKFSAISDVNLYFYHAAFILAKEKNVPFYEMQDGLGYYSQDKYLELHPEQRSWSPSRKMQYMHEAAVSVISAHPLEFIKSYLQGQVRLLLDPCATEFLKLFKLYPKSGGFMEYVVTNGILRSIVFLARNNPLVFWSNAILGAVLIFYLLLAAVGLASKASITDMRIVALFLAAFYFFALSGGPPALGRLRHPIMPIVCLLAGNALSRIGRCKSA